MNRDQKLLCTGAGGSVIAAICCFTPALVILFGAVGLSWAVGYLDYMLLPVLAAFLAFTAYAGWRVWHNRTAAGGGATEPAAAAAPRRRRRSWRRPGAGPGT